MGSWDGRWELERCWGLNTGASRCAGRCGTRPVLRRWPPWGARCWWRSGPDRQLSGLGQMNWNGNEATWVTPLRGKGDELAGLLAGLGRLYTAGVAIDWPAVDGATPPRAVLPNYPFQRQRFPIERGTPARPGVPHQPEYPLLGRRLPTALTATIFEAVFDDTVPVLSEHSLYGTLCWVCSVSYFVVLIKSNKYRPYEVLLYSNYILLISIFGVCIQKCEILITHCPGNCFAPFSKICHPG